MRRESGSAIRYHSHFPADSIEIEEWLSVIEQQQNLNGNQRLGKVEPPPARKSHRIRLFIAETEAVRELAARDRYSSHQPQRRMVCGVPVSTFGGVDSCASDRRYSRRQHSNQRQRGNADVSIHPRWCQLPGKVWLLARPSFHFQQCQQWVTAVLPAVTLPRVDGGGDIQRTHATDMAEKKQS